MKFLFLYQETNVFLALDFKQSHLSPCLLLPLPVAQCLVFVRVA